MARSSDSNVVLALLRDKSFQAREIRRVMKLSLIYLVITTALVAVFYHQMLSGLLTGMSPLLFVSEDIALTNEALPAMTAVLMKWMLIMLGVNLVITIALAMFISRKLGKPILAIKRALREIGNGNLDVRLRSTDSSEFGEISRELTNAMHTVRLKIAAAKESMADVSRLKEHSHQSLSQSEDVDVALSNCRGALEFFQVDYSELKLVDIDLDDDSQNRRSNAA